MTWFKLVVNLTELWKEMEENNFDFAKVNQPCRRIFKWIRELRGIGRGEEVVVSIKWANQNPDSTSHWYVLSATATLVIACKLPRFLGLFNIPPSLLQVLRFCQTHLSSKFKIGFHVFTLCYILFKNKYYISKSY